MYWISLWRWFLTPKPYGRENLQIQNCKQNPCSYITTERVQGWPVKMLTAPGWNYDKEPGQSIPSSRWSGPAQPKQQMPWAWQGCGCWSACFIFKLVRDRACMSNCMVHGSDNSPCVFGMAYLYANLISRSVVQPDSAHEFNPNSIFNLWHVKSENIRWIRMLTCPNMFIGILLR